MCVCVGVFVCTRVVVCVCMNVNVCEVHKSVHDLDSLCWTLIAQLSGEGRGGKMHAVTNPCVL